MGVPLPRLVLPLSGCLNRRTPTRATRGEARGHRSFLPDFARWCYFVDMLVAKGHTARWPWLCVRFVNSLAVWVSAGVGYVHTVAMSGP